MQLNGEQTSQSQNRKLTFQDTICMVIVETANLKIASYGRQHDCFHSFHCNIGQGLTANKTCDATISKHDGIIPDEMKTENCTHIFIDKPKVFTSLSLRESNKIVRRVASNKNTFNWPSCFITKALPNVFFF